MPIFELDPDLLRGLGERDAEEARSQALAGVAHLPKGNWRPQALRPEQAAGHLGLLVLEGLLSRNTMLAAAPCSELLGTGDLLRPWQDDSSFASLPYEADWDVLEPTTVAVLDARFAQTVCQWPPIIAALLERLMERQRWIALHVAIGQLRRVDARLLTLLWHLGDRWGTTRADGVHLPVRLTHALLARLIGAQRPSVTLALAQLTKRGRLRREQDGTWLLLRPIPELADLLSQSGGRRQSAVTDD